MRKLKVDFNCLKYLANNVEYQANTGKFYWAKNLDAPNPKRPQEVISRGDPVYIASHGIIYLNNCSCQAAVLAWYIETSEVAKYPLHRVNGLFDDYRFSNLVYLPTPERLTYSVLSASCKYHNGSFSYRFPENHRRRIRPIKRAGDTFIPLFGWTYRLSELSFLWNNKRWPCADEIKGVSRVSKFRFDGRRYHASITVFGRRFRLGSYATEAGARQALMYATMIRDTLPEYRGRLTATKGVDMQRRQEVWDWFKNKINS